MTETRKGKLFRTVLKKFFYFKMAYSRTGSYVDVPIEVVKYVGGAAVFLKVFEFDNYGLLIMAGILYVILRFLWGHMDIKRKWAHIEASIHNQINPEFMETHANTKQIMDKLKYVVDMEGKKDGSKNVKKE